MYILHRKDERLTFAHEYDALSLSVGIGEKERFGHDNDEMNIKHADDLLSCTLSLARPST